MPNQIAVRSPSSQQREDIMTPLKSILVHLDGSLQSIHRLEVARIYASRFDAEVTALYAVTPWLLRYPIASAEGSAEVCAQLSEWDQERSASVHARFLEATQEGRLVRWSDLGSQSPYNFSREAFCADLMVLGQRSESDPAKDDVPSDFLAHAIIHSGTPALIVPINTNPSELPKIVVIAWNNTRESAKAVKAALPLLASASRVHIVSWRRVGDGGVTRLAAYLKSHGVDFEIYAKSALDHEVGLLLLDFASRTHAELLVMGCYGHSRTREWVFGGVTKELLASSNVPLLMAH